MTKFAHMVTEPTEIRYHLEKAWFLCMNGRKGPVWLDIPLDVQAAVIESDELKGFDSAELDLKENPVYDEKLTPEIIEKIKAAKRPVVFAGTGIRLSEGCRLNIRQISDNYHDFAKKAYKIVVDIDEAELRKPTVHVDFPVHANVKDVMQSLLKAEYAGPTEEQKEWLSWARAVNQKYPATLPSYYEKETPINPYVFITKLSKHLQEGDEVICGNGSACGITFPAMEIQKHPRLFTNSGCAAMGYGFPAAVGVCVAKKGERVICIDGDGSFQMNLQELQTVVYNKLNMKLIIINNNGYHSIRQTQTNLFKGEPLVGVCDGNGLSFPDFSKLAYAYGIPYVRIDSLKDVDEKLEEFLNTDGPVMCEAIVDEKQNFAPKLSSKVLPDGKIVSPSIDDMFPFLSREEYESNQLS